MIDNIMNIIEGILGFILFAYLVLGLIGAIICKKRHGHYWNGQGYGK